MNFRQWTIGRKLWFLAMMSFVVIVIVAAMGRQNTQQLSASLTDIGFTQLPAVRNMTLVDMMHDGIRAVVYRGLVAAEQGDEKELADVKDEYKEFSSKINEHLDALNGLNVSPQIKKLLVEARGNVDAYVQSGSALVDLCVSGKRAEALAALPGFKTQFKALEEKLEVLGETIENAAQASLKSTQDSAELLSLIVAVAGSLLSLLLSFWINRDLSKTLRQIISGLGEQAHALGGSTGQTTETSKTLSASSTQAAAAVQQTAAALEQINAMALRTGENSKSLASNAQDSHRAVEAGREAVAQMLNEIGEIESSNGQIARQIEESNQQIANIVQVISDIGNKTKIINDIVFQTKLLSFNASVEAARAGEHGKGFAVVAEEVGNLAQMSGNASKEIAAMLDDGIRTVNDTIDSQRERIQVLLKQGAEKVESGKQVASRCDQSLEKIVSQASEVNRLSAEISTAIDEQVQGLKEINKAVGLFSESTQQNATTAQGASDTAAQLQHQFQALSGLMGELEYVAGRSKRAA